MTLIGSLRASVERLLRSQWEAPTPLVSTSLAPPAALYGAGVALRNLAYDRSWIDSVHPGIPVVSVGNLLVGGAGKTPVAAWIARILEEEGRHPAVLSRGYGRDEVALHRRWNPEIPVYVHGDRVQGAAAARREGRDCIVLDDGFQHRRLARDLDLVLHPSDAPLRSRLLPLGPFREPLKALTRTDFLLLTSKQVEDHGWRGAVAEIRSRFPDLPIGVLRLTPAGWTDVGGAPAAPPTGPCLAVTGIARPGGFVDTARALVGEDVELAAFPDHHEFSEADLDAVARRAGDRTVLLTEKDAVRIVAAGRSLNAPTRVLRLAVTEGEGCDALRRLVSEIAASALEPEDSSTFSELRETEG